MGLCTSQAKHAEGGDKPQKKEEVAQKTEEKKTETKEEPKKEEVKKEEPKKEEPTQEEPKKAEEPKKEEPKQEEPKQEEPKQEEEPTPAAATPTPAAAEDGSLPPYTNRPEDLSGFTAATGAFVPKKWEAGVCPVIDKPLTGEFVTDGKVHFDKAALSYEGVFSSRDEEVAYLEKAISLKKDAAAETATANGLHEEHNKLYEAGDKDGAKAKLAESKVHRQKAQDIHQESFDMAYAGAMSMAIKACYSKYPSIDYHVFLMDPYEKSYLIAIEMMKKYGKFGRKDFLVIPGEGQHSEKGKGPQIRPHFEKWMADNGIKNEQITSGSYAIML